MPLDPDNATAEKLKEWMGELACPVCFGMLRFSDAAVVCADCAREYPIVDGIPVLISQRAIVPHKQ
jgi:uncharacterized protein YbaR (Trm112 family)